MGNVRCLCARLQVTAMECLEATVRWSRQVAAEVARGNGSEWSAPVSLGEDQGVQCWTRRAEGGCLGSRCDQTLVGGRSWLLGQRLDIETGEFGNEAIAVLLVRVSSRRGATGKRISCLGSRCWCEGVRLPCGVYGCSMSVRRRKASASVALRRSKQARSGRQAGKRRLQWSASYSV